MSYVEPSPDAEQDGLHDPPPDVPEAMPVHRLATHTLKILWMRHIRLLFLFTFILLSGFIIPVTGGVSWTLRILLLLVGGIFALTHLFQLNGISRELARRTSEEAEDL